MSLDEIALFALAADRDFGARVARHLDLPLAEHEERDFEDGEHKSRPLVNVRGRHAFVVQSLHGDQRYSANDKLCRLLFFAGALRDASAASVTLAVPYLCYARKDRKTKPRDPVTTRYVAQLFEAVGCDRVVTLEVHNLAAYQNAFRCRSDHLDAARLFAGHFAPLVADEEVVVVSPDVGGVKRAERFREVLSATLQRPLAVAFMEKKRSGGVVSGDALVGDVADRSAIIIDDLIGSGTTMRRAAVACRERGARTVYAAAAHGLFVGDASRVFTDPAIDRLVVTDSVPPFRLDPDLLAAKVTVLDAAALFAEAIRRIALGGSLVDLLEP